jgi:hypothetical protein
MDGVISGIIVGAVLIGLNIIKDVVQKRRAKKCAAKEDVSGYGQRICTLERHSFETHELAKCTLGMCVIIGDGMIQSGINGDVKRAFGEKKQDALKML